MEERIEAKEDLSGQVIARTQVRDGADSDGIRSPFFLGGAVKGAMDLVILFAEKTGEAFTSFKAAVGGAVDWVIGRFEAFMAMLDRVIQEAKITAD